MFRRLRADEIECRVGTLGKNDSGMSLLLYKDARCDMNILDETLGPFGWQRDHKEVKGNMYCGIGIKHDNEWLWKWDCGTESRTDAEKGESSDSFKRACVNWGIGRELYTAPFIWVKGYDKYAKFTVSSIAYNDSGKIVALEIRDKNGKVAYSFGSNTKQAVVTDEMVDKLKSLIKETHSDEIGLLKYFGVVRLENLSVEKYKEAVKMLELKKRKE